LFETSLNVAVQYVLGHPKDPSLSAFKSKINTFVLQAPSITPQLSENRLE